MTDSGIIVTDADREAYLAFNTLPEFDQADVRAGRWDNTTGMQVLARHAAQARLEERASIVKWLQSQAKVWERMSRKSDARGPEYKGITHTQAVIAASYSDHADAIKGGLHIAPGSTRGDQK